MQRFPRTTTNIIVALTSLAWVIAVLAAQSELAAYALGFIPLRVSGAVMPFAAAPVWLTPLTATLVHSSLIHVGFNMLILLWCGSQVERVLGSAGLIVLYVVGAYAAAMAQWAVDPMATVPVIGASGAISAVIGAYALSFGRAKPGSRAEPREDAYDLQLTEALRSCFFAMSRQKLDSGHRIQCSTQSPPRRTIKGIQN